VAGANLPRARSSGTDEDPAGVGAPPGRGGLRAADGPRERHPRTRVLPARAHSASTHEMRRRVSSEAVVSAYINEIAARRRPPSALSRHEPVGDPGPRAVRSGEAPGREAILDVAGELLVKRGLVGVTIDAVAERAHVDTKAVERWWPRDEALALDVLRHAWIALAGHVRPRALRLGS
jgi:hypothetical protein